MCEFLERGVIGEVAGGCKGDVENQVFGIVVLQDISCVCLEDTR